MIKDAVMGRKYGVVGKYEIFVIYSMIYIYIFRKEHFPAAPYSLI